MQCPVLYISSLAELFIHQANGGRILPECLPLLEVLDIQCCGQLRVKIKYLPALSGSQINGCKGVVISSPIVPSSNQLVLFEQGLPKLEKLMIVNVRELTYLSWSEARLIQDVTSLNRLQIIRCPQLLSLVTEEEYDQRRPELQRRLQF